MTDPSKSAVKLPIYMDSHATTPVDPRVVEEMLPFFTEKCGNAASRNHQFGWTADEAVREGRRHIADLISANPDEIIFTSGATESDNLAIKGVAAQNKHKGNHIVTAVTEHKAVLDSCKHLEKEGYEVTYLPVRDDGLIEITQLEQAITDRTLLVSIMAANNETGVLQPIEEIGRICHEREVLFHSDATQAVGKVPIDVEKQQIDLLSISAHKMYGPKGVGALYVRRHGGGNREPVRLTALIDGGGHEHGMRSGTLNVPGIVGLGKACEICVEDMTEEKRRVSALRDRLKNSIFGRLDAVYINGSMEQRLSGNLNVAFEYVDGEALLLGLNDIAVSSGAACTSDRIEPSYVLRAMGISDELAASSIRFGIGRFNTEAEVDYVADRVCEVVRQLRELSPAYEESAHRISAAK